MTARNMALVLARPNTIANCTIIPLPLAPLAILEKAVTTASFWGAMLPVKGPMM